MIDATQDYDRPELQAWRAELLRALGRDVDDISALLLEGVVRARAIIANLGTLSRADEDPDAPVYRQGVAQGVVAMARYLRLLGLTRRDVHRLDLGRARPRAAH